MENRKIDGKKHISRGVRRCKITLILTALWCFAVQSVLSQSLPSLEKNYIVVTVPQQIEALNKNRRLKSYRPQVHADSTGLQLKITQIGKLPKKFTRVKVRYRDASGNSEVVSFRRDSIISRMQSDQLSLLKCLEGEAMSNLKNYERSVNLFNRGSNGGDFIKTQWHSLATGRPANSNETISVRIRQGLFKKYTFTTDTLPVVNAVGFPAIDSNPCEPFDRFYARKQLKGYGLDKIRYEPYRIPNRKIIRKSFDVFFEKNKASLAADQVQPITDYLLENNLSILDIRIEGYSSIEGDSVLNRKLQSKRAQLLISILQRYNNEPIARDTVIMAEAWEAFRTSLRTTSLKWLDTLNNFDMRDRINSDETLLTQVEPIFKSLRKGKISITLSGRFSTEDIVERLFKDFNRTGLPLENRSTPAKIIAVIEAKLMGMIQYLDAMVQAGKVDGVKLAELVDDCPFPEQARILLIYHLIKVHETQRSELISKGWDSLFANRDWNNAFWVAHTNALDLIANPPNAHDRAKRLRQIEDIQYYTIKYIEEELLDPEVLCSIEYPNDRAFYGVKLNYYAIAYALSERFEFPCYGFKKDTTTIALNRPQFDENQLKSFIGHRRTTIEDHASTGTASFDVSEKGDYYFFLKILFLSRDKSILQFVSTSDNFVEFDLYYLLRLTIDEWNPVVNHYYDRDIQFIEMEALIRTLRSINKRICPVQVNQLYLDYYFKSLVYLGNHATPGDKEQLRLAEKSLQHVSLYYRSRSMHLFPKLTIYLLDALNNFYCFPTKKASTEYAYEILQSVNRHKMLTDEEQRRWEVYKTIYAKSERDLPMRTRR